MKKIILLLIICAAFTSFNTVPKNTFTIVGSWAEDKRTAPSFVFDSEGYAKVVLDGVLKGGRIYI
jgi:uncharacterized secreted protein with C-terminal beta-propeller domain